MSDATFHRAAALDDVPEGAVVKVVLEGHEILLCHTQEQIYAVANRCSHADEELACGRMRAGWIACPAHGARFDLASGEPMNPPATKAIRSYPVQVIDGIIAVEL